MILCFKNTFCFKTTACLSLQNVPYLFKMQGTLSWRCSTAWRQNDISCQSRVLFPRSKHHPLVERGATGQNWTPFLFDIHWLNTIFHSIFLPNWICPADWRVWFQVLVVYFLPDVQTWMCTVYTQDLKPKIFTLYVPIIYI